MAVARWLPKKHCAQLLSHEGERGHAFFILVLPKSWDREMLVIGCDYLHSSIHRVCLSGHTLFAGKNLTW